MIIVSISNKPTKQSSATTAINTTNTSLLNRACIDLLVQSINTFGSSRKLLWEKVD